MSNARLFDFVLTEEDMAELDAALDRGEAGAISWNPVHTQPPIPPLENVVFRVCLHLEMVDS